ncbi:hypothetical protein CHCC15075_2251 [Bacillus licheniformis]|uniref:Uncharacterized protein n=1 Tax=Bacillus licheniformis TaxID=1402 RepID=A0A8B5YFV2_BACLI|nr:hypothetical protein CHCC5024_3593 [Bacillus licheniformis]TWJ96868.1 hypothetical protein CHCC20442_4124 [Bacillus licheniformis]TWK56203.1 hypothetical protein CHCC20345_3805 [Bacillus licheniformis]TWK70959.1 hypothetical protein CHCC20339_4527 [Bacillus licheniformis]TWL31513.1 hypothetical protein CHCC16736_0681 [Bacillus licheniformis]
MDNNSPTIKIYFYKAFHVVDSKGDTNFIKFKDIVGVEMK